MSDRADSVSQDVVFYVLSSSGETERETFIIKLLNKIHREQRLCDVRCDDETARQRLNHQLWSFKPEAFIPHILGEDLAQRHAKIRFWNQTIAQSCDDVLLNIHPAFPEHFQHYRRTIEVLDQSEHLIEMGRQRWKTYKAQGFEPVVHKL
ncbi:MAG: DNA polymerase III subunit chi [Hydrogenovibrio sp.]